MTKVRLKRTVALVAILVFSACGSSNEAVVPNEPLSSDQIIPLRPAVDPSLEIPKAFLLGPPSSTRQMQEGQFHISDWFNGMREHETPKWPSSELKGYEQIIFRPGPLPTYLEVRGFSEKQFVGSAPIGAPSWLYSCGESAGATCKTAGDRITLPTSGEEISRIVVFASWFVTTVFAEDNNLPGAFPREVTGAWLFSVDPR